MKGERTVEKRRERNTKKTLLDIYSKYGIILILILIMAFLTIRTGGTFIGKNNLLNILKQIACIGVLACGQTAVIIAGMAWICRSAQSSASFPSWWHRRHTRATSR